MATRCLIKHLQMMNSNLNRFLFYFSIICFLLPHTTTNAQNLEEEFDSFLNNIETEHNEELENQKREFQHFTDSSNTAFFNYIEQSNANFIHFLKKEWIEIENLKTEFNNSINQPAIATSYKGEDFEEFTVDYLGTAEYKGYVKRNNEVVYTNTNNTNKLMTVDFLFYGMPISIKTDNNIPNKEFEPLNNKAIAEFWEFTNSLNLYPTLNNLLNYKDILNLNDWSFLLLVEEYVSNLAPKNTNKQTLLSWLFLKKAGYNVKIGLFEGSCYLLSTTNSTLYNKPFFSLNKKRYYVLNGNPKSIKTYPEFANYGKPIDLSIAQPLFLPESTTTKTVRFTYNSKNYNFSFPTNNHLIDLYRNYPTSDISLYTNTLVSKSLDTYLQENIKPILDSLNYKQKLEFLNLLVQSNTDYSADKVEFQCEKPFFPEESFFYKKSDCEDRTILFSYLLNNLVGIQSIALDYSGHLIVAAPSLSANNSYSQIIIKGKNYQLIDPTYNDAPIGIITPTLINQKPLIIELFAARSQKSSKAIESVYTNCLVEVDYQDPEGNHYFSVLVTHKFNFGGITLSPLKEESSSYLLKISKNGLQTILISPKNNYKLQIHSISKSNANKLYLLGSFSDSLTISDKTFHAKHGDYIVIKHDKYENTEWAKKLNINLLSDSISYFSSAISPEGSIVYLGDKLHSSNSNSFQLYFDSTNTCFVNGHLSYNGVLANDSIFFETGNTFQIVDWLIRENSRLIEANINPHVSPIFAISNLVMASNISLSGASLKAALVETNKNYSGKDVRFINDLATIDNISNQMGFVTISTNNSMPTMVSNLKIDHNAKIKVAEKTEASRLLVYKGIKIKTEADFQKLNFIQISKASGEVYYDYDKHYRKKLTTRPIILQ